MRHKREARREAVMARAQVNGRAAAEARTNAVQVHANALAACRNAEVDDVTLCLRRLGFRADEARSAAAFCATVADATLEQRVRAALSFLRPGNTRGVSMPAG
jgi:hypothetical protein